MDESVTTTLLYVGFLDGRPHEAFCKERSVRPGGQVFQHVSDYDFTYSAAEGATWYRDVGCGSLPAQCHPAPAASGYRYWIDPAAEAAGEVQIVQTVKVGEDWITIPGAPQARRLTRFPRGYRRDRLFAEAYECEWVYCAICKDEIDTEDRCDHVWWCEVCGWWNTECDHPADAEEEEAAP